MTVPASTLLQRVTGWFGGLPGKAADVLPVRVGGTEYRQSSSTPASVLGFDQALLWVVVALLAWGLVMVYSASIAMPDNPRFANYAPTHFLTRHMMYLVVGFVAALLAFQVPMALWERVAPWLFIASILALIVVLIPGVGTSVNGARRWLPLGIANLQPSELMKLFAVLYAADYTVRKMAHMHQLRKAFLPMSGAMVVVGVLLLKEPDFGAFVVIISIAIGILFLGGMRARLFAILIVVLVVAFAVLIIVSPYRRDRIFGFMDPWADAYGRGYQLSHALIAFGRGEVFGVGLGASIEKLFYLPEANTDFLLAVIAEELGFSASFSLLCSSAWLFSGRLSLVVRLLRLIASIRRW